MKYHALFGMIFLSVAACASEPAPRPTLPEGVPSSSFTFVDDSYLRGVRGAYNTSPRGRPAAILDVTYNVSCIAEGAQSRLNNAKQILDESYVVAPLYFNNPREHGQWARAASEAVAETGCIVSGLSFNRRTTDLRETTLWAILNSVPPAR